MFPALAVVLCLANGFALVSLCFFGQPVRPTLFLRLSLSIPFGFGLFSVAFLVAEALGVRRVGFIDCLLFVLLSACYVALSRRTSSIPSTLLTEGQGQQTPRVLRGALWIAVGAAAYCAVVRTFALSHGDGWDAFAIWNLHARFLFRGAAHWRDGLSSLISWSHPDYPLLLPAAVAHFWDYLGYESPLVPGFIALAFTFSTVGVLFSALRILRGPGSATFAALALLATPAFITQGTSQYADVPLSAYFLAAVVVLCVYCGFPEQKSRRPQPLLMLAGISASFAAWTKNEGLLFLCALAAAIFVVRFVPIRPADGARPIRLDWFSVALFCLGVAPVCLLVVWFKHSIAPPGDLFGGYADAIGKLQEGRRYWVVAQWFAKELLRFGEWSVMPGTILLAVLYLGLRQPKQNPPGAGLHASVIALALTLAGYFFIYLITPYDLYWHLRFSLNRLFLQVWPSAIFIFFLILPVDRVVAASQNERAKMGVL